MGALRRTSLCLTVVCLLATCAWGQSVTRPTFVALQDVREMMDEERYEEALVRLEGLLERIDGIPYDFALTNQYLAHVSVLLDDSNRAQEALEVALASDGLPRDLLESLNLFYGTVLLNNEEFELALRALETWYSLAQAPVASQLFSLAFANFQNGNLQRAETLIDDAIGAAINPQESWYQLLYRALFEQKKYDRAEQVLQGLIERNPGNAGHWRMLASHYLQLEDSNHGLATLMVAYLDELIRTEGDLRQITSLWGYIDAPDKGARMMEQLIEEGRIQADAETLKQLANLWLMARERNNAITALQQAAGLSPDGNIYAMLGGIHFEDENWDEAYGAYQGALRQGELEEPMRISFLAGISAFRSGRNDDARAALEVVTEGDDAELRDQAQRILRELR